MADGGWRMEDNRTVKERREAAVPVSGRAPTGGRGPIRDLKCFSQPLRPNSFVVRIDWLGFAGASWIAPLTQGQDQRRRRGRSLPLVVRLLVAQSRCVDFCIDPAKTESGTKATDTSHFLGSTISEGVSDSPLCWTLNACMLPNVSCQAFPSQDAINIRTRQTSPNPVGITQT